MMFYSEHADGRRRSRNRRIHYTLKKTNRSAPKDADFCGLLSGKSFRNFDFVELVGSFPFKKGYQVPRYKKGKGESPR